MQRDWGHAKIMCIHGKIYNRIADDFVVFTEKITPRKFRSCRSNTWF